MSNESKEFLDRDPAAGFAKPGQLTGPLGSSVTPIVEPIPAVEEPNLVFIGRQRNPKFVDEETTPDETEFVCLEPVTSLTDGHHVIQMPEDVDQKKPFYHAEARRIRRLAPKLYADPSDPAVSKKGCCGEGE